MDNRIFSSFYRVFSILKSSFDGLFYFIYRKNYAILA